uniref:Interferon regulatory factor 3 n=1 Tax=Sphaeramia orbicularis TaxID=375764 RepID=A0A673ANR1_9TELE
MAQSRPLLIPWLRTKLDSGNYPGVNWTNPERTEFCIPWKHALRQDSTNTDVLIFKAWAEVTGNGRAQGDASVWKRNFRSALRAKGFKMIADNKNDAANPHKVFRWPDESRSGGEGYTIWSIDQNDPDLFEDFPLPVQEVSDLVCLFYSYKQRKQHVNAVYWYAAPKQDILEECLKGLNIGPETGRLDTSSGMAGFEPPPEQQQLQNQVVIGGHVLRGQQQYPVPFEGAVGEAGLPEQPAHPMEGAVGGACSDHAEQFLHTMSQTNDGDHFKTQFKVIVYYRGVKVSEQLVENESGVRIVYRPELRGPVLDQESGLSLISLPTPGDMHDKTQANLTHRILDRLDGLDVGVSGHVVYGQRHGDSKVFWSMSKFDQSKQPQEVSKLQPQTLFLFREFIQGGGKDSPPCSLFFCLGEKWPDPDNRPWVKKLITVEVVLTSMELLKNLAVANGASSLQSVDLQMSLEEMMEMC